MKGPLKLVFAVIFVTGFSAFSFSSASDIYITPNGSGQGACTSNPQTPAFFNSSSNWGSGGGQIGPGTTVHLCGVFDGGADHSNQIFAFQGSGTSGKPVTLFFEAGAIVQADVCPPDGGGTGNGGCISMSNRSYIVIDGGNSGQAGQGNLTGGGTVQNTDNGDELGHHCGSNGSGSSDCTSTLIDGWACSNCTIKNLKLLNTYVKVLNNTSTGVSGDLQHSNTMSGSHITISNNTIANCGWCVFDAYGNGDTDVNVFNNDISGFGHGMMYATSKSGSASIDPALRFYGNNVHDTNSWTTPSCNFHNDGLHMFGLLTGTSMDGLYIHDNYFHGVWGHCATGFVYLENGSSNPSHAKNWAVWNNIGDATAETTWDNTNGWFGLFSGESGTQRVFNNVVMCGGPTHTMLAISMQKLSSLSYQNNVVTGCSETIEITSSTMSVSNFNFYGPSCANGSNCFVWNGTFKGSFPSWKSGCGCDSNGMQNNTPLLNADGSPQTGSPVIGLGANLSSFATGELAGLKNDTTAGNTRTGTARPGSGAWDVGAFSFGGTSDAPNPPTGLAATVN